MSLTLRPGQNAALSTGIHAFFENWNLSPAPKLGKKGVSERSHNKNANNGVAYEQNRHNTHGKQ